MPFVYLMFTGSGLARTTHLRNAKLFFFFDVDDGAWRYSKRKTSFFMIWLWEQLRLTDVVVSESISKTFIPGPTLESIRSIRDIIRSVKSIFDCQNNKIRLLNVALKICSRDVSWTIDYYSSPWLNQLFCQLSKIEVYGEMLDCLHHTTFAKSLTICLYSI